jgi:hypothetical protein
MPNNPLTLAELSAYTSNTLYPQIPAGYFFASPPTGAGPLAYRLFDASYISIGIINPNRLGTGSTGAGNLYLADDGTWKSITVATPTLAQVTTAGNTTTNSITVGGLVAATNLIYTDTVNSRVGIGTTSPIVRLTVVAPSNTVAAFIGGGLASPAGVGIGTVNSGVRPIIQSYTALAAAVTALSINPSGGNVLIATTTDSGYKLDIGGSLRNTSDAYFATTSGSVGIGTTSPAYKLDVQGTTLANSSVSVQGAFNVSPLAAPPAISSYTLSAGTNLGVGTYYYFVTFVTAIGETSAGANLTVTTTTGNTTVNLTGIPISTDPRVIGRKIYRTLLNQTSDAHRFLVTINDNTTTTYTDSATDASLTGVALQYYKVNTTARYFTVSGVQSMVIDQNLTALGRSAGNAIIASNGAAVRTVLIGADAGKNITTGQANVIVGVAGVGLTTGNDNSLVGDLSGYNINSGGSNSIFGAQSGRFLTGGARNLILGAFSGRTLADGSTQFTSGTNNTIVGGNIRMFTASDTNSIVIGYDARGLGSNTTVIGNSSTIFTSIPAGNLAVGTTTNSGFKLDVNGTARVQGAITSTALTTDGPVVSTSGVLGSVAGYTGMVTIQQPVPLPPVTCDIQNGIIVNVL